MTKLLSVLTALTLTGCVTLDVEAEPITPIQKKHVHCFVAATVAGDPASAAKHKEITRQLNTHRSNIEYELGYAMGGIDVIERAAKDEGADVKRTTLGQEFYKILKCGLSES